MFSPVDQDWLDSNHDTSIKDLGKKELQSTLFTPPCWKVLQLQRDRWCLRMQGEIQSADLGAKSCTYAEEQVPESLQLSSHLTLKVLCSSLQGSASCTKVPLTTKKKEGCPGSPWAGCEALRPSSSKAHALPRPPSAPHQLSTLQTCPNTDRNEFSKSTAGTMMAHHECWGLSTLARRRSLLYLHHHLCFTEASARY